MHNKYVYNNINILTASKYSFSTKTHLWICFLYSTDGCTYINNTPPFNNLLTSQNLRNSISPDIWIPRSRSLSRFSARAWNFELTAPPFQLFTTLINRLCQPPTHFSRAIHPWILTDRSVFSGGVRIFHGWWIQIRIAMCPLSGTAEVYEIFRAYFGCGVRDLFFSPDWKIFEYRTVSRFVIWKSSSWMACESEMNFISR